MDKTNLIKYLVHIGVGLLLFGVCVSTRGVFDAASTQEMFGLLSDCFLVPGLVMGGIGLLSWVGSEGTFTMLRYGFSMVFNRLIHPKEQFPGYYEYATQRNEERKPWLKHSLIVGTGFFVLSLICLGIYAVI